MTTRWSPSELRRALAANELFGALSEQQLDQLLAHAHIVAYPPGAVIFQKHDPGHSLMIVLRGLVKISNFSLEGREAVHALMDPGSVFGEMALLDGKDRSATATTLAATELLVLLRRDFIPFLERNPRVAVILIEVLCARLRQTTAMVEDGAFLGMAPRIARALLRLAKQYSHIEGDAVHLDLRLSQRELGGLVGLARENVNRQLRAWHHEGLIRTDHGHIIIDDLEGLQSIAEEP
jgi:CRP/FNR family transcriptional regulator, cyclic AMP receptor protein